MNKQKSKLTNKGSFIIESRLWNIVQTKLGIVINHLHNLRMILSKVNKMLFLAPLARSQWSFTNTNFTDSLTHSLID